MNFRGISWGAVITFGFASGHVANAQALTSAWLQPGTYAVGFRNEITYDHTRTYTRLYDWDKKVLSRPISLSMWYPAADDRLSNDAFKVGDYMRVLKNEEEWETLRDDRILSWFYYPHTDRNRRQMDLHTMADPNAPPIARKFPVVIYAPSYQASSVENFSLCEFLASHGFVVLSSPSRGAETRFLEGGTIRDIEAQARDIEFLIGIASAMPNVDIERVAVVGFSFGGISNVVSQMRDGRIKALVCLDGAVKYQFPKLSACGYSDLSKVDVPFIFMSQKDIPLRVMIEDKIDTTLNRRFEFFDSLKYSEAYYLKFNDLTHPYFSTMGVMFQDRDARQDKTDREIMESYVWVRQYTLHFLNAFLKGNESSRQFMDNDPFSNGAGASLISIRRKKPLPKRLTFEDFHVRARGQGYKDLESLLKIVKADDPLFQVQEWKLNNLGLQLLFNGHVHEAINVLLLATILFPNSANAFDSLAEAFLVQDNKELAIRNFSQSLKLDAQNSNAKARLEQLRNNHNPHAPGN